MIKASTLAPTLVSIVALAATAQVPRADPPNTRLPFQPVTEYDLLQIPSVLQELDLTAAQEARLGEIKEISSRDKLAIDQGLQDGYRLLGKEPDREQILALSRRASDLSKALDDANAGEAMMVLNPAELGRLEQIRLQAEGPVAFTRPDLQGRLDMSPKIGLITPLLQRGDR